MFEALPTDFPKIRGLLYFDNFDDGMDWPLETSCRSADGLQGRPRSTAGNFQSNTYASLNTSPIPAP